MKFWRLIQIGLLICLAGCGDSSDKVVRQDRCLSRIPEPVSLKAMEVKVGSNAGYREERLERMVKIEGFDIDATEVTNGQFAKFIKETGYVTDAEKQQLGFGKPGAAVFTVPNDLNPNWWLFVEGAQWRTPEGPESTINGRGADPVVQVSYNDAKAYTSWAGRRLPTQEEWEYAARAGSDTRFVWGEERNPDGKNMANTWQGAFPIQNTAVDGYHLRAPVGCFPPNGFGLYDMIGNVWEWTDTLYKDSVGEPVYTIKGGSYLCADNYCRRYTPTSRQPQEAGLPTNHIGFRTVKSK